MALGAHMRPYSYMYCTPHRDGVLHNILGIFINFTYPSVFKACGDLLLVEILGVRVEYLCKVYEVWGYGNCEDGV